MNRIAIIGTAGRDKSITMTRALWDWMLGHAMENIEPGSHLVSGGAAWADHIAVALFLNGHAASLMCHLPAPLDGYFRGPRGSAASAANYYHGLFSNVIGEDSLAQLELVSTMDHCDGTFEPEAHGYGAMFARNKKVAQANCMLAYTFGEGLVPADGGTKDTWDQCKGRRIHVPLPRVIDRGPPW